ncbi:PRTRC system protein C [Taibaiella koreensis]|uniref:PRTRC system protein C n=1 Tax=Taibaiella koreensis TaxID=1268548 RepID=UPI000E5A028E|nr:PRTRC system protein C [Taibaiella koreensis]
MLVATALKRVFLMTEKGTELTLTDPEPSFSKERVRDFYSHTYPVLTTATIEGPEVQDDQLRYRFVNTIGTKG